MLRSLVRSCGLAAAVGVVVAEDGAVAAGCRVAAEVECRAVAAAFRAAVAVTAAAGERRRCRDPALGRR